MFYHLTLDIFWKKHSKLNLDEHKLIFSDFYFHLKNLNNFVKQPSFKQKCMHIITKKINRYSWSRMFAPYDSPVAYFKK